MATINANSSKAEILEMVVDEQGLVETIRQLATLCYEKEEHLRENWQEENSDQVKTWHRNGGALGQMTDGLWRQSWER